MTRHKGIIACAIILIIGIGTIVATMPRQIEEEGQLPILIQTLFANEGELYSSGSSYLLADDITLSENLTIYEIGNIDNTRSNDTQGFGFEVDWNIVYGKIWITVDLSFHVPETVRMNLTQYAANITLVVNTFHNSSFFWQFDIPSIPLEETQSSLPSYWKNGTSSGNETIVVNTLAQKTEKFEIALIDGCIHAQFAMVVNPDVGDFSRVLITFGKIDIWDLNATSNQ